MTDLDPVRLRDAGSDAPAELRRALAQAREVPADRLARVGARLGTGHPGQGSGSGPAATALRTIGVVGAAVVAVGVGLVVWQWLGTTPDVVPVPSHAAVAPTSQVARRAVDPVPSEVPTPEPTPAPVVVQPRPIVHSAREPETEAQLLLRARRALTTRAPRALALVREHARRFPDGALVEEREALRVEALVASGRVDDARRALAHFHVQFPGSAHLEHLSQLISAGGP